MKEINTEEQKRIGKFITRWIAIWYHIFVIIFFGSWYGYSEIIARAMPKANGEPFEEIGMFFGMLLSAFTLALTKLFYDWWTEKILNKITDSKN